MTFIGVLAIAPLLWKRPEVMRRGLDLLCFSHILDDGREGCTRQLNFDLVGGYAQTHLAAIILSLRLSISRNTFENSLGENRFR